MSESRNLHETFQEFPNNQGIFWNIGTNQPGGMFRLECLEIGGKIEVRSISDQIGYPVIGEITPDQMLEFFNEAQQWLPNSPFTAHLFDCVEKK